MKTTPYILMAIMIAAFTSCGIMGKKKVPLTSQQIEAYLKTYKELREKAPATLNDANSGILDTQKKGFSDFEGVTKNNGLSYPEFVRINAKVGAIYSILQGDDFMGKMENMREDGMVQMDDGMKQMDESIAEMQKNVDDPNFPEEGKKEMRKSIEDLKKSKEEMKESKETINKDFEKNKKWADLVMNKVKAISNIFISKEDVDLVKKYFDQITEAYTGGVVPTNFNVKD